MSFYALNRRGAYGGASIWPGMKFAVNTGEAESRTVEAASLYPPGGDPKPG